MFGSSRDIIWKESYTMANHHGYQYDFNIIYYEGRENIEDNEESLKLAELLTDELEKEGKIGYFNDRDILPGKNIFSELFRVINSSHFTIVLLSPAFVKNSWARYTQQAAFLTLLDRRKTCLVPLAVLDLPIEDIPEELGVNCVVTFEPENKKCMNKLKAAIDGTETKRQPMNGPIQQVSEEGAMDGRQPLKNITVNGQIMQESEDSGDADIIPAKQDLSISEDNEYAAIMLTEKDMSTSDFSSPHWINRWRIGQALGIGILLGISLYTNVKK